MKFKLLITTLAVLTLLGCEKTPESTTRVGLEFQVDKLFTVDSCTVYRFKDGGRSRYFTNCQGSTSWTENCGKNCTQEQEVYGGYKE